MVGTNSRVETRNEMRGSRVPVQHWYWNETGIGLYGSKQINKEIFWRVTFREMRLCCVDSSSSSKRVIIIIVAGARSCDFGSSAEKQFHCFMQRIGQNSTTLSSTRAFVAKKNCLTSQINSSAYPFPGTTYTIASRVGCIYRCRPNYCCCSTLTLGCEVLTNSF